MVIELRLTFDEKEGKQLTELKDDAKNDGLAANWEDYILRLAGVRE